MLLATCLLATSLFTCEWDRPGKAPRLQPKPVEIASLGPVEYNNPVARRFGVAEPDPERFGTAEPDADRFGAVEPDLEPFYEIEPDADRFGELAFAALPPAVYGDYAEPLEEPAKKKDKREKRRAEKAKREEPAAEVAALPGVKESLPGVKENKIKKKVSVDDEELAYAAPAERGQGWLASMFRAAKGDDDDTPGTSRKVAALAGTGYDAVSAAARRYGPGGSKFEKLAKDITYTESRGRCGAVSSANALGVMQTKLGTAKLMGYKGSAQGLKNCRTGAEYGVKYLAYCHDLANGDVRLTSVCYNQGHGVLTNPKKYGKLAKRKEAVNYVATMKSRGWRM